MKSILLLLAFVALSISLVAQAVTVDNNASITTPTPNSSPANANAVTTLTLPFTVSANNNRLLLVCVTNTVNADPPVVTFNDVTMTQVATREQGGNRATTYYAVLGSSASATTANIVADGTTVMNNNIKNMGAISFYNVQQSNPYDGQVSTSISELTTGQSLPSTISRTVSSRTNDMICDCMAAGSVTGMTGLTAFAGQTEKANNSSGGTNIRMGMSTRTGASPSVNAGWTINGTLGLGQAVYLAVNIRSVNAPLPVELTYFKGQTIKNGNQLLWQTASERNSKGFYIQRSEDGRKWQDLAFEPSKSTTLATHNYEWIDQTPLLGYNYYRLKQIDNDGRFHFSPVITITEGKKSQFLAYPNPTTGELFYESDDFKDIKRIHLYDATGKLLQATTLITGKFSIANLPSGLYALVIYTANGRQYQRIVKQ
jgi:hypothetical protein